MIYWIAACGYKQQALAQIVLQATLQTICEIYHPILLFGTILLLSLKVERYAILYSYLGLYVYLAHKSSVLDVHGYLSCVRFMLQASMVHSLISAYDLPSHMR